MSRVDLLVGLQHLAAGFTLLVAGRFAFVEARAWSDPLEQQVAADESSRANAGTKGPADTAELVKQAAQTREQTLAQFKDELASATPSSTAAPAVQQRHIFVDFGPPRSKVYIAGKLVGQTPFGGQISCVEGKTVDVVVLPDQGAPLARSYECLAGPRPPEVLVLPSALGAEQNVSNLKPPPAH